MKTPNKRMTLAEVADFIKAREADIELAYEYSDTSYLILDASQEKESE